MIYDVIIIGAGPAGISSSNYCNRLGLKTVLLYDVFGGQINYCDYIYSLPSAPNILSGKLIENYWKTVENVESQMCIVNNVNREGSFFSVFTDIGVFRSKAVIACTGAIPKNIPQNIVTANVKIPILNFKHYPFFTLDKMDVIVIIGGGYVGLEIANQLSDQTKEIYVIEKANFLGANENRRNLLNKLNNVYYKLNSEVQSIIGSDISISTPNGKLTVKADCVFLAHGISPTTEIFDKNILQTKNGIEIFRGGNRWQINMCKNIVGLFAAGDVVDIPINGFVSLAEGMGIETAKAVYYYVNERWKN